MVGGTNQNSDLTRFRSKTPDILVATPGRLNDNLKTDRNMTAAMGGLRTLVFDEADRLLDMGFRCRSRCKAIGCTPRTHHPILGVTNPRKRGRRAFCGIGCETLDPRPTPGDDCPVRLSGTILLVSLCCAVKMSAFDISCMKA